jgi:uncharacterized membrane protein YphA (DoxX/SURF4 family)
MGAFSQDRELKGDFNEIANGGLSTIIKYYSNPDFVRKVGEQLGEDSTQDFEASARTLATAIDFAQSEDMPQMLRTLKEDPELGPKLDEMESGEPGAVIKYYTDPEFLRTVGDRLGEALGLPQQKQMALSMRKSAGTVEEEGSSDIGPDLGALALRIVGSALMVHNGLDKLSDPAGFAKFVVEPYLHLPEALCVPATYAAAGVEIVGPVLLILGIATRLSSLGLLGTMGAAIIFHINQSGLEGFPFAVVKNHAYAYETATLYAAIFGFLALSGPGKFSLEETLGKES